MSNEGARSPSFSIADFRKNMTEALATVRYRDEIIDVSYHGKPWASVVPAQSADAIRKMREVGKVGVEEVRAVANALDAPVGLEELVALISAARRK